MVQIIGGGKDIKIGKKIKPKCIVHYNGDQVDRFEDFIAIGFREDGSAKLHTPTDLLNIANSIELLTKFYKEEYEQLEPDVQKKLDEYLKKRGDIFEQNTSKST